MPLNQLAPTSKIWIYQSKRDFTTENENFITKVLSEFVNSWQSHGAAIAGGFEIVDHRFIIIAADEQQASASGCSIDKSVRILKDLEQELGVSLFDRLQILYKKQDSAIEVLPLPSFKNKLAAGEISAEGWVVNTQVTTVGALKRELWQQVKDSWLAKFLPSTTV